MYDLNLSPEQIEFRDTIRDFARERIQPAATHPDRLQPFAKPLLTDLLDEVSGLGVRTLCLSETAGGVGMDCLTACLVFEELSGGDVDIAVTLAHTALASKLLFDDLMSDAQKETHLGGFVEDATGHLAFAHLSGSAAEGWDYHASEVSREAPPLTVEKVDGGWILDGRLDDVLNAGFAGLIAVYVPGQGVFLVPKDASGLTVDTTADPFARTTADGEPAVQWSHGAVSDCVFTHCVVPVEQHIPTEPDAAKAIRRFTDETQILQASINLGFVRIAMESAIEYAKIRRQGGRNIVEHQGMGAKIADMSLKLEAARNLVWKAAWVSDNPEAIANRSVDDLPYAIMAQMLAAESANEVALLAAEHFGAMGVMRDMALQKYVNDSFIFLQACGHDSSTKLLLADAVSDYRADALK
jgi:alkylation response protein AidB-like acyl-CoA dehydrogenase